MRWMVTGAGGQLGRCLVRRLEADSRHCLAVAPAHADLDLSDRGSLCEILERERPDVVANAAAFTFVDRCETEPELAHRINAEAPGVLAEECEGRGIRLVHVSTDYVFDGRARSPYAEGDPPAPTSEYGRSKLEGERRVEAANPSALILRTSWVFGPGRNFVATIVHAAGARRASGTGEPLRVVDDQFGSPTYADDLAGWTIRLVEGEASGVYHLANRGIATWWEVAREALDRGGFSDLAIERVATSEFPRPAPRPAWSVLDCRKADEAGIRRRGWREALAAYLESDDSPLRALGEMR